MQKYEEAEAYSCFAYSSQSWGQRQEINPGGLHSNWLWETEDFKQLECLIQKREQIGLKPEKHFYLLLGINTFLPTGAGTKKFPDLTNLACARGRSHGVRLQGGAQEAQRGCAERGWVGSGRDDNTGEIFSWVSWKLPTILVLCVSIF